MVASYWLICFLWLEIAFYKNLWYHLTVQGILLTRLALLARWCVSVLPSKISWLDAVFYWLYYVVSLDWRKPPIGCWVVPCFPIGPRGLSLCYCAVTWVGVISCWRWWAWVRCRRWAGRPSSVRAGSPAPSAHPAPGHLGGKAKLVPSPVLQIYTFSPFFNMVL